MIQVSNKTQKNSTIRIFTSYIFLYVIQITFVITITLNLLHFFVLIPELAFKTAHNLSHRNQFTDLLQEIFHVDTDTSNHNFNVPNLSTRVLVYWLQNLLTQYLCTP